MLTIVVHNKQKPKMYDYSKNLFVYENWMDVDSAKLELEHSLVSISKWESKWHKVFLNDEQKTNDEIMDYIKCMTLNDVPDGIYNCLTKENFQEINSYIQDPMTATKFVTFDKADERRRVNRESKSSEMIYYWMISENIPVEECQHWHLNRLLTLIRLCNIKNNPDGNKMSKKDAISTQAALNKARRAKSRKR